MSTPSTSGPKPLNSFTLDSNRTGSPLRLRLDYDADLDDHGRAEITEILAYAIQNLERVAALRHPTSTSFRMPPKP